MPFTYSVTTNSTNIPVQLFPAAYISDTFDNDTRFAKIPIFHSLNNVTSSSIALGVGAYAGYYFSFKNNLNTNNNVVILLPGYKLELYSEINYNTLKETFDNSNGDDVLMKLVTIGGYKIASVKLYHKSLNSFIER
jgi:hypothetical protein